MNPGTRVEVRTRFNESWGRGFDIAEIQEQDAPRYRIRRRSDGSVLPTWFGDDEVREERRKSSMWWY